MFIFKRIRVRWLEKSSRCAHTWQDLPSEGEAHVFKMMISTLVCSLAAMASALPLLLLVVFSLSVAQAQIKVFDLRAIDLPSNLLAKPDGYVKVSCGAASLGQTSVREDSNHPWWEEEFQNFNAKENDILKLEVLDSDFLFDDLIGVCQRPVKIGTHSHDCFLAEGGTLHYSYTLS